MPGGHFNYDQVKIENIADEIKRLIHDKDHGQKYSNRTVHLMKLSEEFCRIAKICANRVDWLTTKDDSEQAFQRRMEFELGSRLRNLDSLLTKLYKEKV